MSSLEALDFEVKYAAAEYVPELRFGEGTRRADTGHVGKVAYRIDPPGLRTEWHGKALALVGPRQTTFQPADTMRVAERMIELGLIDGDSLKGKAYKGGAYISLTANTYNTGEVITARGHSSGPVKQRMSLVDYMNGLGKWKAMLHEWVKVCGNGMMGWAEMSKYAAKHTSSIHARVADAARALEKEATVFKNKVADLQQLADTPLGDVGFKSILDEWFPANDEGERSTRAENQRNRVQALYHTGAGADPGSLWGAYQAATNWITHHRGRDGTREEQNLLGTGARLNSQIFKDLKERAIASSILRNN